MNELIYTIIIKSETAKSIQSIKELFQEKLYFWQNEEWLNGWLIEILRFNFYNKDGDLNQHCDIIYRVKRDPEYLEVEERLKTGL